jgi:hypothetical protein
MERDAGVKTVEDKTTAEISREAFEAGLENLRDARMAMLLIREAIETLGPVGCLRSQEDVCRREGPSFHAEALELIRGIQAIAAAR